MESRKSGINLDNSSKTQENNTIDLVDRISDLPDFILGYILSNLPTKNAVATTILSKRWKSVWMTVDNLDFCRNGHWRDNVPEEVEEDMKFARFVDHVLLLHNGGLLNKFSLVWSPWCIHAQVRSWINTAITRNVHHLFVSVWSFHNNFEALEMPIGLFSCVSLQSLELNGTISFSAGIAVCLPRLECLKLVSVYFKSEEAFEKLISGCPMLNDLHLYIDMDETVTYSKDGGLFKYIISSTSLRRLELHFDYSEDYWYIPGVELKASSLEYLVLNGYIPEVSVQGTLSSLVKADFNILFRKEFHEDVYKAVVKAVHAFDSAKALTLSPEAVWALTNATIRLPKFRRLRKLVARATSCFCSSLQEFIQSSDNLEVLTIYQDLSNPEEYHDHSKWIAPVEVPRCLSNSLKAFAIRGYGGYDDEHEMIGYMLKHGSVLKVIHLTSHAWIRKEVNLELVKEMICRFPRKLPALEVELWGEHCSVWSCSICRPQ